MGKKSWSQLSRRQKRGISAAGLLQLVLASAALRDLRRRPADQVRGPKQLWTAASGLNFFGPIAYFGWGRRKERA